MHGLGLRSILLVAGEHPKFVSDGYMQMGGGIMEQREYLYPRIRERMDGYLLPFIAARTRLAMAQLGNRAGMLGAFYHFRGCQTEQRQKDG